MFSSINGLLESFEGNKEPERYLYRGQLARRPRHKRRIDGDLCEIENIYPSDFRFIYDSNEESDTLGRKIFAAREYGRQVRDQFVQFIASVFLADGAAQYTWAQSLIEDLKRLGTELDVPLLETSFYRKVWSLAQHYLLSTALTDLTFDPRVAAWFATNPWEKAGASPAAGDVGVVYRFDRIKLEQVLARETTKMRAWAVSAGEADPPPALFLVDIRDIPAQFAKRPSAQQGASLYGFDQPQTVFEAFSTGSVEVFEFKHRAGVDVGRARDQLVPEQDPFQVVLKRFRKLRALVAPSVKSAEGGELPPVDNLLERVSTVLGLPLRSARLQERLSLEGRFDLEIFDQIESLGRSRYQYLMALAEKSSKALLCVVGLEESEDTDALKKLPPEAIKALGLGTQVLGIWDGGGRRSHALVYCQNIEEFKVLALLLAKQVVASVRGR